MAPVQLLVDMLGHQLVTKYVHKRLVHGQALFGIRLGRRMGVRLHTTSLSC